MLPLEPYRAGPFLDQAAFKPFILAELSARSASLAVPVGADTATTSGKLSCTSTRHHDHFNEFKVAAIAVLGTSIIQRHLVAIVVPIIYTASMGFRGMW